MQVTCPNPGCDAVYTVDPEHVGRSSVCKTCGISFVIESDGLRLASDAPGNNPAPDQAGPSTPPGPTRARRFGRSSRLSANATWAALNEPFTWMLIAGTLLVIFFLFQPIIDNFKVSRIRAEISRESGGDLRSRRFDKDEDSSKDSAKLKGLREDLEDAQLDARAAPYIYTWFVMLGFLLLAVAEIGYLVTGAAKSKRVVGAVLLSAQLLLIYVAYMVTSIGMSFRF